MCVRTCSDRNTDPSRRIYRRSTASGFSAILPDKLFTAEVHRILDGPAHTERFHALETFLGCVVQMSDRPTQSGDGNLLVDLLKQSKEFVDRCVMFPVHRQSHSVLCGPFDDLITMVLLSLRGFVIIVHIPGNAF